MRPEIESEPSESQSVDSIYETAPKHKSETSEEEDPLRPEFLRSIEPDIFEDFGNTSRYFCQKRPPSPVTPMDPIEKDFLLEMIQELTTLISNKWLQEGESSLTPIHLNSPSSSFRCRIQDQNVDTLYSPAVGANLMSDEFALAFLGNYQLTPTDRCWHFLSRYRVCEDLGNNLKIVCWQSLVQSLEMRASNPF